MGRHSLCRGREAPEFDSKEPKARRADTTKTAKCTGSVSAFQAFGSSLPASGGSRHRQRLCRPPRPESHSFCFRSLCFYCEKSFTALPIRASHKMLCPFRAMSIEYCCEPGAAFIRIRGFTCPRLTCWAPLGRNAVFPALKIMVCQPIALDSVCIASRTRSLISHASRQASVFGGAKTALSMPASSALAKPVLGVL